LIPSRESREKKNVIRTLESGFRIFCHDPPDGLAT
jgi:hypothetical protein